MKVSINQGEFEHKDVYRNLMYSKGDYRFKGENGFDDAVGACVMSSRTDAPSFTPSTEPEPGPGPGPIPPTPEPEDGSDEHPWLIKSLNDLLNLKAAVEGTASEDNPYRADHYYKQTADISLAGETWTGIGLLSDAYNVDTDHSFKGSYDGDGHSVTNMTLHVDSSVAEGTTNRYLALFRAVNGGTIKNLTVNVLGFDAMAADDVTGAAIVGLINNGATLENCVATGTLGTSEVPVVHMTGGVICRVTNSSATAYDNPVVLTKVTNKVNIICARKVGGIIASGSGKYVMTDVVNEGNITKTGTKSGDSIGGIIGYTDTDPHNIYVWNNVKNTGTITTNTSVNNTYGQLMGTWHVETNPSSNTGEIIILNNDMPLSKYCPTTGNNNLVNWLPIYFGEVKSDGLIHTVSTLEDGKDYIYLVGNISESSNNVVTPPAYVLSSGASITVDQKFGTPNITTESGTAITGELVEGTVYRYTAEGGSDFPDPTVITDPCTVSIPSNIVDGGTITGTELDTATGSMTVTEKRVTQFQAKFAPGSLGQSADTISPVITFNRCVIGCELEFYGDCAASGKPITIVFNNCIFDGSEHHKQFLFLQYGAKYEVQNNTLVVLDSTAVAKYNIVLNNIKFINLSADKNTRALFKGFGSTLDRVDTEEGGHFDISAAALDQATIMANSDSSALVTGVSEADKTYSEGAIEYYDFQAGSNTQVTNIKL